MGGGTLVDFCHVLRQTTFVISCLLFCSQSPLLKSGLLRKDLLLRGISSFLFSVVFFLEGM